MSIADVVRAYHRGIEQGDWGLVDECLADSFVFSGPTVQPLNKRALISSMKALWAAFPDIGFNLRIVQEQANQVKGVVNITGTHTGTLIPPFPDRFMTVAPTGKKISLVDEPCTYLLEGNQIIRQEVEPRRDGGWPGIFRQLGLEYPYPLPDS
ncbi:MAG: ester cyclase [Chloroflexaceae bacterium]|nr:ester cyclase [Chloroflexaceae bacterium]